MSSRRDVLKAIGASGIAASLPLRFAEGQPKFARMPAEGKDTPKICLGFWDPVDEASMRRRKQIGVDYVLTGGPKIPWTEADVRARIDQFNAGGLTLYNMMVSGTTTCRRACRPGTAWAPTRAHSSSSARGVS